MPLLSKPCSHHGCTKLVFGQDKCHLHNGSNAKKTTKKKKDTIRRIKSVSKDGSRVRLYKQCAYPGCTNIAKKNIGDDKLPVCYTHGATRRTCSAKGCPCISQIRGLCRKHYRRDEQLELLDLADILEEPHCEGGGVHADNTEDELPSVPAETDGSDGDDGADEHGQELDEQQLLLADFDTEKELPSLTFVNDGRVSDDGIDDELPPSPFEDDASVGDDGEAWEHFAWV